MRKPVKQVTVEQNRYDMQKKLSKYVTFKLTSNLSVLTENEREMLPVLIKAASIVNTLFWFEAYGDKNQLLNSISDGDTKKIFVKINYGPWDRLDGNKPFVDGVGNKPAGANFYPPTITKEEFNAFDDQAKLSLYTFIRRNKAGNIFTIPYYIQFKNEVKEVSDLLFRASKLGLTEKLF